ncbi:putative F-box protein At2g36090 [Bidens hawaiensis]|uniref:putative F-box protein At2g36090 n=1 Tax=Bidens hawaiensis TaxID=980011 RepID=UPI00404A26F5
MAPTLADIPPDIIQTHILPRLDGQSLSTIATVSSHLHSLCSDHNLWSHICMCTWPSITHQHVDALISTFPGAHQSFFQDSFPSLIIDVNHRNSCSNSKLPDCLSQLISAVDIRYQTDIIYSTVQFTDITTNFLSSEFNIKLTQDQGISGHIDMKVDVHAGIDKAALAHLKESVTLNWIVIDPSLKRAGNLSSIKAASVKRDWASNKTIVKCITVLPGCDPNEMVQCCIYVVLGLDDKGEGLQVKEVTMKMLNLDSCRLSGGDFLVVSRRAVLGENNMRRKVVDDKERWERHCEFKETKSQRRKLDGGPAHQEDEIGLDPPMNPATTEAEKHDFGLHDHSEPGGPGKNLDSENGPLNLKRLDQTKTQMLSRSKTQSAETAR